MARVYKPPPTSALAVISSLLVGSVAAMIGVAPYAYFVAYMPFVYLNGVACICYGALIGSAVGYTATRLKLANRRSAALVGASVGVLGLYVAWCVSRMARLSRLSNNPVDFTLNPAEVYRFALFYYEHGLWSVGTSPKTQSPPIQGFRLVWFWLCEAGVILGFGAGVPLRRVGDRVFCSRCRAWATVEPDINRLSADHERRLKAAIRTANLAVVVNTPRADRKAHDYFRLDLATCPVCKSCQFLTIVKRTLRRVNTGNGIKETVSENALGHLCLEPGEVA